jgi:6-pyruvoyltetrahydropterin/6-carboxytetrahydropterin synthase
MFSISLRKDFISQHSFPNSVGPERFRHSHPYKMELTLLGEWLGEDGFLVDLERMGAILDEVVSQIDGAYLNDLPEFQARNPSLENFSKVIWTWVAENLEEPRVQRMKVTVWESGDAWASYEQVM